MGGYRPTFFGDEENNPLQRRLRESMFPDLKFEIDPKLAASVAAMQLDGSMPLRFPSLMNQKLTPPTGGWQFNPLQGVGSWLGEDRSSWFKPGQPAGLDMPWTNPKKEDEPGAGGPSARELGEKAGLPRGLVNLFTPPPDLATPQPETPNPAGVGPSARDEAIDKAVRNKQYKERTGKEPVEMMIKLNVDEKGRVWFGF